jgi:hypothetical protein
MGGMSERPRISLKTLLLFTAALPIWAFLAFAVPQSTGWGSSSVRFVAAPLALLGTTIAIHRLVRHVRDAWAVSMFCAAIVVLGSLAIVSFVANR